MEKIPSSPIYSKDGPQHSPEPERPPTPEQPKLVSFNDSAKTICDLIKHHYEISPKFPVDFAVINQHVFRAILLGETHGNDTHAVANARVVDYLWKACNGRLLLLTEDGAKSREPDGQARFVLPEIAVERWDQLKFPEVDIAFQNLSQLSISSVNEMNEVFKNIGRIQNILSRIINLDESIENLKLNSSACFAIKNLSNEIPNISMLSERCFNISLNFVEKLDKYNGLVKILLAKRDQFLHSLIQEKLLKHHEFKICVMAGTHHILPALEFLNRERIAALLMIPKVESEQKSHEVEYDNFKKLFSAINDDLEKINEIKTLHTNIETLSVSWLQLKLFNKMMRYLDAILELFMVRTKAI